MHEGIEVYELSVASNASKTTLGTTAEHPFWVVDRGWTRVADLGPGDRLTGINGDEVIVKELRATGRNETVYNIEVDTFHTYSVGELAVWVHNKPLMLPPGGATRLTVDEIATGQRLSQKLGIDLKESPHIGADYVDDAGRAYDAMGSPAASQNWNPQQFLRALDKHLVKDDTLTALDLTGFTPAQKAIVQAHIDSLPAAKKALIIPLGF